MAGKLELPTCREVCNRYIPRGVSEALECTLPPWKISSASQTYYSHPRVVLLSEPLHRAPPRTNTDAFPLANQYCLFLSCLLDGGSLLKAIASLRV